MRFPDQQSADLQSDLEDFDLLESDASDCEPKPAFLPEDNEVDSNIPPGHLAYNPEPLHSSDRLSPEFSKITTVQDQNAFFSMADVHGTDNKPKIWSLANTVASLDPSLEPEYPPCMLATGSSSPGFPSTMALPKADRKQESPVDTLREWVDGVFHAAPFHPAKASAPWSGLNDAAVGGRAQGQPFALVRSTSSLS